MGVQQKTGPWIGSMNANGGGWRANCNCLRNAEQWPEHEYVSLNNTPHSPPDKKTQIGQMKKVSSVFFHRTCSAAASSCSCASTTFCLASPSMPASWVACARKAFCSALRTTTFRAASFTCHAVKWHVQYSSFAIIGSDMAGCQVNSLISLGDAIM